MSNHPVVGTLFWISFGLVVYTYVLYPALLAVWARCCAGRSGGSRPAAQFDGTFSLVMCVHNEAARVRERVVELQELVLRSKRVGEIIVVSDGSSDGTAAIARSAGGDSVRVLELAARVGKARALTLGCREARGEILVFADVRQRWKPDSIDRLLDNFALPSTGAVSGDLVLEPSAGTLGGVGLYWRYEKWIRHNEGLVHSTVGVSGAICAVRRALFKPIPQGIVLDDVYWPMQVVLGGHRVVHDLSAIAYDQLPPRAQDEMRRKIRTLSGNFQLIAAMPSVLVPVINPVWIQFWSHKVLRLVVPWLLLMLLAASASLHGLVYAIVFWVQVVLYAAALLALAGVPGSRSRFGSAVTSFVLLNVAAWLGFWIWLKGGAGSSWNKTQYQPIDSVKCGRETIRVAFVIDTFNIGGTELNALRTLETLDRARFDVTVFHLTESGPLRARYEALGVRMIHLPIFGFRSPRTLWQALRFGMLLRKLRMQVSHSHDVYTNIFSTPWARVIGRCGVIASRRWLFEVPRPALNPLNRWSYWFAHRVLANSGVVARLLTDQEGVPPRKIVEIPNFLSAQAFVLEAPSQRLAQRRQWGLPDEAYVVGIVARLAAVKNHAMLLHAIHALQDDTHLVLIGQGAEEQKLRLLAADLGLAARVHFVGAIVSPINLHQYFEVSVLCSLSEGFPNTIIEALAARRAVVATSVGGVPDVVDDGVTGLLVPSEDAQALARALRTLRLDPDLRDRLGAAGEQRVSRDYSQQIVIAKVQDLYTQMASHGQG